MDAITTILLIVIPYILYRVVIYYLEEKQDIEINKMAKSMIFIIVDIIIMIIANGLSK
jgi:uncharacterized membrane protein (GlpM family)